jgi:hypothetical protein
MKRALQSVVHRERITNRRREEEFTTLAGVLRIAREEMDRALSKEEPAVTQLELTLEKEKKARLRAEAKLKELRRSMGE